MNDNWIDHHRLADLVGRRPRTILTWCRERRIPHMRLGRNIMFTPDQVRQIEAAYKVEPIEELDVDALNPHYTPSGTAVVVPMVRRPVA